MTEEIMTKEEASNQIEGLGGSRPKLPPLRAYRIDKHVGMGTEEIVQGHGLALSDGALVVQEITKLELRDMPPGVTTAELLTRAIFAAGVWKDAHEVYLPTGGLGKAN